jgi:hypothetical protein
MTTDRGNGAHSRSRERKARASKASLRTAAWAAAGVALAAPWVALKAEPRPLPVQSGTPRKVIIVHRTIRRIVIDPAAPAVPAMSAPKVRNVYVGGGTVTTGGGSTGTTRCSGC